MSQTTRGRERSSQDSVRLEGVCDHEWALPVVVVEEGKGRLEVREDLVGEEGLDGGEGEAVEREEVMDLVGEVVVGSGKSEGWCRVETMVVGLGLGTGGAREMGWERRRRARGR